MRRGIRDANQQGGGARNFRPHLKIVFDSLTEKFLNWTLLDSRNVVILQCFCIDPLYIMGMQPIWRTKQNKFYFLGIEIYSHVKKYIIVLSSKLAAFPRTCKGSIYLFVCLFVLFIKWVGEQEVKEVFLNHRTNKCGFTSINRSS